jgi:hypothetical protein
MKSVPKGSAAVFSALWRPAGGGGGAGGRGGGEIGIGNGRDGGTGLGPFARLDSGAESVIAVGYRSSKPLNALMLMQARFLL